MNETTAILEPATLTAMGIRRQPFRPPSENELYSDDTLDIQVRMLRHNLQYSDMLQVLYGEAGSGKTCLAIRLVDVVNHELEMFVVRGEHGLTSSRIVADLLRAIELEPGADADADLGMLASALNDTSEVDAPTALVIDDAHLLETDQLAKVLRSVVRINETIRFGFRLLLMAEPALESRLQTINSPMLLDGKVYVAHLKPLSIEQTEAYLAHRLALTGASWPFSDDEVVAIAESARGLPGDINEAAAQSLNYRHSPPAVEPEPEQSAPPPPPRPNRVAMVSAAAAVILAVVVWLVWPSGDTPEEDITTVEVVPLPQPEAATPTPILFKDEGEAEIAEVTEPPPETATAPTPEPVPNETIAVEAKPEVEIADSVIAEVAHTPSPPAPSKPEPDPPQPEPEPPQTQQTVPQTAQQTAGIANAVATAPARSITDRDQDWLRQQTASQYVIQLMAANNVEIVEEFVRRHDLGRDTVLFVTRRNGAPWHVLVYGLYPNADSARKAIPALPAPLRRYSPWIRSIGSVHLALDKA